MIVVRRNHLFAHIDGHKNAKLLRSLWPFSNIGHNGLTIYGHVYSQERCLPDHNYECRSLIKFEVDWNRL